VTAYRVTITFDVEAGSINEAEDEAIVFIRDTGPAIWTMNVEEMTSDADEVDS
jgi:hypothetical protein